LVRPEHRILCDARRRTHTHHCKLERDLQLTHHAQEPFIGFLHPQSPPSTTARNGRFKRFKSVGQNTKNVRNPYKVEFHATSTVITTASIAPSRI